MGCVAAPAAAGGAALVEGAAAFDVLAGDGAGVELAEFHAVFGLGEFFCADEDAAVEEVDNDRVVGAVEGGGFADGENG